MEGHKTNVLRFGLLCFSGELVWGQKSCDVYITDVVILAVFVTHLQLGSGCDFTAETVFLPLYLPFFVLSSPYCIRTQNKSCFPLLCSQAA